MTIAMSFLENIFSLCMMRNTINSFSGSKSFSVNIINKSIKDGYLQTNIIIFLSASINLQTNFELKGLYPIWNSLFDTFCYFGIE